MPGKMGREVQTLVVVVVVVGDVHWSRCEARRGVGARFRRPRRRNSGRRLLDRALWTRHLSLDHPHCRRRDLSWMENQEAVRRTMGDDISASVCTRIATAREGTPDLSDTAVVLSEVFELRDTESDQTKAKRPFGLKELFAGLVQLSLRLDPPIE